MKTRLKSLILILGSLVSIGFYAKAQDLPFEITLSSKAITSLPGLHSYAFAQANGKWLIVGGRKDGIHARQPFNAFPQNENNTEILVVDPLNEQVWFWSVNNLPTNLREQLQATNFCFHQVEDTLYIAGGYAYSSSAADHITFPFISTLVVSEVINAITQNGNPAPFIKQTENQEMAVTGGQLGYLNEKLLLIGGHRFDGRYNPMGHSTYVQEYTNAIKSFKVNNAGIQPLVYDFNETIDQVHLHRRDYNLLPQQFGTGTFGYMISSGVFQVNADLPFLYPVEISASGHIPITAFNQYLSNYHSAHCVFKDEATQNQYSLFFGGISQYQYVNGVLSQDNQVPFVKTISALVRDSLNNLQELSLPIEMPLLQGASAEFIPNEALQYLYDEIAIVNTALPDSVLLGHIYGGIKSSQSNPFNANNIAATEADDVVYEVWLHPNTTMSAGLIDPGHSFSAIVYPNPGNEVIYAKLIAPNAGNAHALITDIEGKLVQNLTISDLKEGEQAFPLLNAQGLPAGSYAVTFVFDNKHTSISTLIIQH
jgi:hypothetical protein